MTGEYQYIEWDGGDAPYEVIRGHVSDADAMDLVAREGIVSYHKVWKSIEQKYARWVPTEISDFDMMLYVCSGPARGAFPVTLLFYE